MNRILNRFCLAGVFSISFIDGSVTADDSIYSVNLNDLDSPELYSLVQNDEDDSRDLYFLAVDAGGTKTSIAVYCNGLKCIWAKEYSSKEYSQFQGILGQFRKDYNGPIHAVGMGLAGPVQGTKLGSQSCKLTNRIEWETIRSEDIASLFMITPSRVLMVNDLMATAYGIGCLTEDQIIVINEGRVTTGESQAVIAPGTGLGNAALHWNGEEYLPYPSEGGHMNFAPRNENEIVLLRFLQEKMGSSYVSIESVISGSGISMLYYCLVERLNFPGSERILKLLKKANERELDYSQVTAEISEAALRNEDITAVAAMQWFISLLGNAAGTSTLYFCATGGCYIAGGIPVKIASLIEESRELFMAAFADKGPYKQLMLEMPVKLVLNSKTATIGAGYAIISSYRQQRYRQH